MKVADLVFFLTSLELVFSFEAHHNRTKRFLVFPPNSATGVIIAIAVPLEIPHFNVFISYNFESNYSPPILATDYTQGLLTKFPSTQAPNNNGGGDGGGEGEGRANVEPMMTRRRLYQILESHVGRPCLLRTICEVASNPFSKHNGFFGDIVHIAFLPSMSVSENLDADYDRAEDSGWLGDCSEYEKQCSSSLLDIFTTLL